MRRRPEERRAEPPRSALRQRDHVAVPELSGAATEVGERGGARHHLGRGGRGEREDARHEPALHVGHMPDEAEQ